MLPEGAWRTFFLSLTLLLVFMGSPWVPASAQVYLVPPPVQDTDDRGTTSPQTEQPKRQGPLSGPLDGAGTLDGTQGGLGPGTWAGLTQAQASALIEALPVGVASAAMNDLARRVLLSHAAPPVAQKGASPGDFLALRLRKAFQMGFQDDVADLFWRIPPGDRTDPMIRSGVMALVLGGNGAEACRLPLPQIDRDHHALRMMAYCRVEFQGHLMTPSDLAEMAAILPKDDALVPVLERRVYLTSAPLPQGLHFDPLSAALLRNATFGFPDDVLETARPWLIRAVAETRTPANGVQQQAAQGRAAGLGLLPDPAPPGGAVPRSFHPPPHLASQLDHLQRAAAANHPGETALLALCLLGSTGGPKATPGDLLSSVLGALERVGLGDDARKLAAEALPTKTRGEGAP